MVVEEGEAVEVVEAVEKDDSEGVVEEGETEWAVEDGEVEKRLAVSLMVTIKRLIFVRCLMEEMMMAEEDEVGEAVEEGDKEE